MKNETEKPARETTHKTSQTKMDIFTGESASQGRSRITFNDEIREMGVGTKEGVDISDFKLDLSQAVQPGKELVMVHCCHENTHVPSGDKKPQLMVLGFCGTEDNMREAIQRVQSRYPVPVEIRQSCVAFTLSKESPNMQNVRANHEKALKNLKVSVDILQKNRNELEKSSKEGKQAPVKITNESALGSLRESFKRSVDTKPREEPARAGAGDVATPGGGEEEGKEEEYDLEELEQPQAAPEGSASMLPQFPISAQARGQNYAVVCVIEDFDCTLAREKIIDRFLARRTEERSTRYQEWLAQACGNKGIPVPSDEDIAGEVETWASKNPSPLTIRHEQKRERLAKDAIKWLTKAFLKANRVLPDGFEVFYPDAGEMDEYCGQEGSTLEAFLRKKFVSTNPDLADESADLSEGDLRQWWENEARKGAYYLPQDITAPEWENEDSLLGDGFADRYLVGEYGTPCPGFGDQEFVRFDARIAAPPKTSITTQQEVDDFDCYLWARRLAMEKQLAKWKLTKTDFPAEEDVMRDWDLENPPPAEEDLPQEEPGIIVLNCFPTEAAAQEWIDQEANSVHGISDLDLHVVAMYEFVHPPDSRRSDIKKKWRNKQQHKLLTKMADSKAATREVEAFSRSQGKKIKVVEAAANAVGVQEELPKGVTAEQWEEWQRIMKANGDEHRARMARLEAEEGKLVLEEAEFKRSCKMARIKGEDSPEIPQSLLATRARVQEMRALNEDKCDDLSAMAPGK